MSSMRYKTTLPLAALLATALALPAVASAANTQPWSVIPVPAGEVQHTVTQTVFQSNVTVPGETPWARTQESWDSADAFRNVMSDTSTGELLNEHAGTPSSCTAFIAERNTLFSCHMSPALESWETQASKIKQMIAKGELCLTGQTTFLGRPAYTYTGPAENGQLRIVVDAATGYPLEQAVSFSYGSQTGTQVSTVTAFETLSPAAAAGYLVPQGRLGVAASRAQRTKRHRRQGKPGKQSAARR